MMNGELVQEQDQGRPVQRRHPDRRAGPRRPHGRRGRLPDRPDPPPDRRGVGPLRRPSWPARRATSGSSGWPTSSGPCSTRRSSHGTTERTAMTCPRTDARPPRLPARPRRAELADAGRPAAGRPGRADRASRRGRSSCSGWRAGPSQLETFDPHPGTRDRRRDQGDRRPPSRASSSPRGSSSWPSVMGDGRAGPVAGEQGGGPRARHVPDEDRLPARPDRRASLDRRDLLPRAAGRAGPRSPGTSRSCPASGRRGAGSSAASSTPSRSDDPAGRLPDVDLARRRRPRRRRGSRDLDVVERAFARGRRGRVEATLHRETHGRAPG